MVTNKSQSDSSFCVIINIFENKGLFMIVKSRLLCKMLYNVFTISTYQN